jgi:hypothetical protein
MLQFNRGHMNTHMIQHTVCHLWEQVKCKFIQDDLGLWYNVRLDIEKEKRKTFTESRRNNIKPKNKTVENTSYESHMNTHMKHHMENVNENINKDIITNKSKCTFEEVYEYMSLKIGKDNAKIEAEKFVNYYESNGWKVGKNTMKSWTHAANNWITNTKQYAKGTTNNTRKLTKGEQFNIDSYNLLNSTTYGAGDYDRIFG